MARRLAASHRCPNPTVWTVKENSEMAELEVCPFCHAGMTANTNTKDIYVRRYGTHYRHPQTDCILSDFEVSPSEIAAWNRRPPTIPADVGRRAMEAMEGVVRVADRKTDEFDAARAAITELKQYLGEKK
jgi:hypothetical protein